MRIPPFRFVIVLLALACASESHTQWEWAGGVPPFPPGIGYETVASAGKWIIAGGNSEDALPACSTDGGESWAARGGIGPVAFNPVLVTSPAETLALAVGYGYTVYRMRALLANMTTMSRLSPFFQEKTVAEDATFFDLLKLLGFQSLTITDGEKITHQVTIK